MIFIGTIAVICMYLYSNCFLRKCYIIVNYVLKWYCCHKYRLFADMALNKQINKLFADLNWEWHDVVYIRAVANYKFVNL